MKKILLIIWACVSIFKLNAQSQCGTDEYNAFMKRTNPQYAAERQKMEQEIYSILKNKQNNPNARIAANDCEQPNGIFTIPIVVHVIHKGEPIGTGFNISDAQIQGAIQGMNERWRRVTGDGVDLEIQFALAVRDTNNNATNGITRYDGRVFTNYNANGVYSAGLPGASTVSIMDSTVWDRSKYINVWVVDLRDACGFSSLGGSYTLFMQDGCMSYNSTTLGHEMGHTFGLHHTFAGDGSGGGLDPSTQCPPNNDCLLDGDWICDTPPHKKNECSTTSCANNGDLQNSFRNYMSYCGSRTRFTQGQKDRVRTFLYRDNFWSLVMSDGLMPVNTQLEVGIVSIENNIDEPICNGFIPKIKIKNSGNTTITNLKVDTYIDGVYYQTTTINTNLIRNNTQTYSLQTINFNTAGYHDLYFSIIGINGSTSDYQSLNNHICKDFLVRNNPVNTLCLNLEDNLDTLLFKSRLNSFSLTTVSGCSEVGFKALKYENSYDVFYLPNFNLDSVYSAYLTFNRAYKQGVVNSELYLLFYIIDGCDSIPKYIYSKYDANLASVTGRDSITTWSPTNCTHWLKDSMNLTQFQGKQNLLIRVGVYNYETENQPLYLDNFCIHKKYRINTTANPTGYGYVTYSSGNGVYDDGNSLTVSAMSYNCYEFVNWTENGVIVSTNPIYTFTVNKNRNLVANFKVARYKITVTANIPYAITQGFVDTTTNFYCNGATVQMFAQECCCYKFANWTENGIVVSTAFNYTFIATQSRDLVANYVLKQRSIFARVNDTTKGYVLGSGVYDCGSNIILQAHVKQGAKWLYWTYYGSQFTGGNDSILTITVTNSNDSNYVANFTVATYSIATSSNIANAGTLTGSGTISFGTTISVTATPASCYTFKNWTENGIIVSNNANYTFTVSANRNLVANFEKKRFTIAVSSDNIANGSVAGNGNYACDTITTVTATPASCYNFIKWTENGSTVSTNVSYSFTVTANRNLLAIFETKRYNITLAANPTNGGTIFNAGSFACDSMVTVKAKINTGYKFTNWTEGNTIVSTDSNYTFLVNGARNLKANFSLVTGIKQSTINEISRVYPNPANDILQVEIRSKQNTSLTLNIIDMKGSLLETKALSNSKGTFITSFDVSKLSKGNYILNLYDEEGMASYKFVVQ